MDNVTLIGIGASIFTACSLLPQLVKLVREKKVEDVSLFMLTTLLTDIILWICYGAMINDIIIISNSFALIVNIITVWLMCYCKASPKR